MEEETEQQIAGFLSPYREEIRSFAQALRTWLKEETMPAVELAGQSAQSFNIGFGFTTTAWDCYCAIIVYRNHINISLPSGAVLSDPERLLHGTGKRVRHLKIRAIEDLQIPPVRDLLMEARQNSFELAGGELVDYDEVRTIVKTGGARGKRA